MVDVFISYKKEDLPRVEPIARQLAHAGYEVWWDHQIPVGRTYRDVIGAALAEAKCVIVVWSKQSISAQWVLDEADEGKKRNVLLPLLIDETDIPFGFRQIETARLAGWSGDPDHSEWRSVLGGVAHFVGRPPGGPPKPFSVPSRAHGVAAGRARLPVLLAGAAVVAALGIGGYYAIPHVPGLGPAPKAATSGPDAAETPPAAGAPTGPAGPPASLMTGVFETSFGRLVLGPEGGEYDANDGRVTVTRADGRTLEGIWEQSRSAERCSDGRFYGRFRFTFSPDGFTGTWAYCDDEPSALQDNWDGQRVPS